MAEVVDDEVSVLEGRRVVDRFREIEVELAEGAEPADVKPVLDRDRRAWRAAGRRRVTKVARALGPRPSRLPTSSCREVDAAASSVREVIARAIADSVVRLIEHDAAVRLGEDPEGVHQARVATRRLRSHLRTSRSMLERDWCDGLREELGWLGDELGAVRDLDVLEERFRRHGSALPGDDAGGARAGARSGAPSTRGVEGRAARGDARHSIRRVARCARRGRGEPSGARRGGRCAGCRRPGRRHGRPVEAPAGDAAEAWVRSGRRGLARSPHQGQARALRRRVARARLRQARPSVRAPGGGPAGGVGRTPGCGRGGGMAARTRPCTPRRACRSPPVGSPRWRRRCATRRGRIGPTHGSGCEDQAEVLALKTEIRAAGGIVRRRGSAGPEFALVHRPRYDDWTFPKGKAEPGEADEDNAEREVREETGLRCERGPEVATIAYDDHAGRPKTVRYWLMYPAGGAFVPNDEVDQLRWVDAPTAAAMLTYDHDRRVLESALAFDRPARAWCATRRRVTATRGTRTTGCVRSRARAGCRPRRSWACSPARPSTGCSRVPRSGACRPFARWPWSARCRSRSAMRWRREPRWARRSRSFEAARARSSCAVMAT